MFTLSALVVNSAMVRLPVCFLFLPLTVIFQEGRVTSPQEVNWFCIISYFRRTVHTKPLLPLNLSLSCLTFFSKCVNENKCNIWKQKKYTYTTVRYRDYTQKHDNQKSWWGGWPTPSQCPAWRAGQRSGNTRKTRKTLNEWQQSASWDPKQLN